MAVDLNDFTDQLGREMNPPGSEVITPATGDEFVGRLMDAFWDGRLDGLFAGYVLDDETGEITPVSGSADLPREMVQAIIFLAAYKALMLWLINQNTTFRSKAGPVEFERGKSAQVLKDFAQSLRERRNIILFRLSDLGMTTDYVIDAVIARQDSLTFGDSSWAAAGAGYPHNIGGSERMRGGWL